MILSKIVMIAGMGCLLAGFLNRRLEVFRKKLFKDLQTCSKYHADYLEDEKHLPINKPLVLFGPPSSITNSQIISPCFIKKSPESDRLWNFHFKQSFVFKTATNQEILVRSGMKAYAFNLPQTQRVLKQAKYEQRAILHGIPVCVYGTVKTIEGKKTIIPQIIMGDKHQSILVYLDKKIMQAGKRGKMLMGAGVGLLGLHWMYFHLIMKNHRKKPAVLTEIEQFK